MTAPPLPPPPTPPLSRPALAPGPTAALRAGDGSPWWAAPLAARGAAASPVYLEASNADAVRRVIESTPDLPNGQQTAVVVASSDADLPRRLGTVPDRVRVLGGPDAGEQLAVLLNDRDRFQLNGHCLVQPGLTSRVRFGSAGGIEAILQASLDRQRARLNHVHQRNLALYGPRDAKWWSRRFDAALSPGSADPLRVLIVTTRYSTFVRHSSEDLQAALAAAGCDARLLIEPDAWSTLTSVAYADAIADQRPDLLVAINYARPHLNAAVQLPLPLVCWVQDAMAHLFDAKSGAAMGPLDFLIGHMHTTLFTQYGYNAARALHAPVPVCTRKFHAGAVPAAARERFTCDVAYVGHQSEPPQAMRDRLIAEGRAAGPGNAIPAIIDAAYGEVVRIAEAPMGESVFPQLTKVTADAVLAITRREPDAGTITHLMHRAIVPLADRAIRHQMLRWATELTEPRAGEPGVRFHLYGRGWDRVPVLAPFARDEVTHGEDLRACYQLAACHLHASISTSLHQRVLECALSGGLPLVRLKREDLEAHWLLAQAAAMRKGYPDAQWVRDRLGWSWSVDYPEAMQALAQSQRVGLVSGNGFSYATGSAPPAERADSLAMQPEAVWVLGDLSEIGFSSSKELAQRIERSRSPGSWRTQVSTGVAKRTSRTLSYDAAARRMIDLVRSGLRAQA